MPEPRSSANRRESLWPAKSLLRAWSRWYGGHLDDRPLLLSPKDIARFRSKLLALETELLAEGDVALEPGRTDAAQVGVDDDEQPIIQMTQAIASNRNQTRASHLQAIHRALARIATDDFGVCSDCGEDIATKRLEAIPWVELCIDCQARQERQSSRSYGRRRADDFR